MYYTEGMQLGALSVSTVLFVLAVLSLASMVVMLAYLIVAVERIQLLFFALSKLAQGVSWFLRFLDTVSPLASNQIVADMLLVASCAIEAGIYLGFMRRWKPVPLGIYLLFSLVLLLVAFLAPRTGQGHEFTVLAAMIIVLFWLAALSLFRRPFSAFRITLSASFALLPILLLVSFLNIGQDMYLLFIAPSFWGIMLLSSVFMFQMLLTFGYFLITKERDEERMRGLAETDSLTGIANRRAFFQRVNRYLESAKPGPKLVSVILSDLDFFKKINDTFGHDQGDNVIKHFCEVVQSSIRGQDLFARFGGEEFIIFLPNTNREEARLVASRIAGRLHTSRNRYDDQIPLYTASMGICTGEILGSHDFSHVISMSDKALYFSKNNGRDCSSWVALDSQEIVRIS